MKVYKYRGIEEKYLERDIDTFKSNQFFAPKFEMLNDPFEGSFNETISEKIDLLSTLFSIDSTNIKNRLNDLIQFKNKLGIFSLSKSCTSEQMWAHYANSHQGYCIEYDIEKLNSRTHNSDFCEQLDVFYSEVQPTLDFNSIQKRSMLQKMFGTKKENWKYEEEIRLIFDNSSLKSHHESAITGVYFGYKTPEYVIEKIRKAFIDRSINFYKIKVNEQTYQLEPKLIHTEIRPQIRNLENYNFDILKYHSDSLIEIYYIHLKDSLSKDELNDFVGVFREANCYLPSNLYIFNTSKITHLIGVYPLKGIDYIEYANAFIALADSDSEGISFYDILKNLTYEEELEEITQS